MPDRIDLDTTSAYQQGAHLTRWQPTGHEPVLWVSDNAVFKQGTGIRGGIPVCFPWFGQTGKPSHGFARITPWRVELAEKDQLRFALTDTAESRKLWPFAFAAEMDIIAADALNVRFAVTNTGDVPCSFELALHTYLTVADVRNVALTGFDGVTYIDTVGGQRTTRQQHGEPAIEGEVDRIYQNHTADVTITDPGMARRITVKKTGSKSTVLWNPHIERARDFTDFGADEWPRMLCVETANVGDHAITLAPGAKHATTLRIEVEHV